jgi:polar amino acid transport system substrate-binding protein
MFDPVIPHIQNNLWRRAVKKNTLVLVSLIVLVSLVLTACGQKTSAVKVATDATFPPFETIDEQTKQPVGFDIDMMEAVAKEAGFKVEWVNIGFDAVTSGVSQCQYDAAAAAITITDERKKNALFSDPYINAGQIITVAIDNTTINGVADLSGKKVGAQLGTTGEIEAKNIAGVEVKSYDTYDLAFLDVINGQIDAVIADYPTALGFIGQNADKLKTTGEVFTNESYGIMVCKDKTDLVDKINKALATLKANGTITKLEQKWLASSN